MAKTVKALTTAVGLLAVGGLTYLLFRPCTLLMFRLVDALGAMTVLGDCRSWAADSGAWLPEWVVYILAIEALLAPSRNKVVIAGIMPVAGAVTEWLQAIGVLSGTFDVLDIVAYTLPYLAYIIYYAYQTKTV